MIKKRYLSLLLAVVFLFSCSKEEYKPSLKVQDELGVQARKAGSAINKLGAIKLLNPDFKTSFITSKQPGFKIITEKRLLKDLDGNVLSKEVDTIQLFETSQFQHNNFKLNIGKFHISQTAGVFGPNEQEHLRKVIKRFRKIYSHPHFMVYMSKNESGNTPTPNVLYNKLRSNAKTISFARKKGISGMKVVGSKIFISSQIKFPGGVKPLGKLSHEIGHVYGYGHGTNVNAALERFVKHYYVANNPKIPNYDVYDLNDFEYKTIVSVDAPLNGSWILTRFRKKETLKAYDGRFSKDPSISFDLIDGNRTFSGYNGCTEIAGNLKALDYSSLLIKTVNLSPSNCSRILPEHLVKLLKSVRTYEVNGNQLLLRKANGKVVLSYKRDK